MYRVGLKDERDTLQFGGVLAQFIAQTHADLIVVFLRGNLGAGKTTLSRGVLRYLGYQGAVKSPTYTLVEHYDLAQCDFYHFDIYRLGDPEELEYMGIRDFLQPGSKPVVCLIEWPEKGEGLLPEPDVDLTLDICGEAREANLVFTGKGKRIFSEERLALLADAVREAKLNMVAQGDE